MCCVQKEIVFKGNREDKGVNYGEIHFTVGKFKCQLACIMYVFGCVCTDFLKCSVVAFLLFFFRTCRDGVSCNFSSKKIINKLKMWLTQLF